MDRLVALVLLAAGESRRFHGNKLLSLVQGKVMYRHLMDRVEQLGETYFYRKIVVTQYPEIMRDGRMLGYEVVENRESSLGISHSIELALDALDGTEDAVCFAVCDQPWLKKETLKALLEGWEQSGRELACLSHRGELGNPAVFSWKYFPELRKLSGDMGGKKVIKKHLEATYLFEVENGEELMDIDVRG